VWNYDPKMHYATCIEHLLRILIIRIIAAPIEEEESYP